MNATPDPSPLPSVPAVTGATGLAAVLGYGGVLLAGKLGVPLDVAGGLIGLAFTGLTALWHRLVPSK
jgi:hypothetical protein